MLESEPEPQRIRIRTASHAELMLFSRPRHLLLSLFFARMHTTIRIHIRALSTCKLSNSNSKPSLIVMCVQ